MRATKASILADNILKGLKPFKNYNSATYLALINKMAHIVTKINAFHKAKTRFDNPEIVERRVSVDHAGIFNSHIEVLSAIGAAVGTRLYCKLILEDNDIEPSRYVLIIGHDREVRLTYHLYNYIVHNEMETTYRIMKAIKSKGTHIIPGYRSNMRDGFLSRITAIFREYNDKYPYMSLHPLARARIRTYVDQKRYGSLAYRRHFSTLHRPRFMEGKFI